MIYLDHAATTPLDEGAFEAMKPYMTEIYGNPNSQHAFGRAAANALTSARDDVARIMGVPSDNLFFTSGGTEAGNTALKGVCAANRERGRHVILSAIEHPALLESAKDMRSYGYEVTLIDPDGEGFIRPGLVARAIRPDTVFVGVMAANNEVGTVQPIADIYSVCRERGVFFYCDCVQTAGTLPFSLFPADGIGISAHKFYGPKGFGALYMRGNAVFKRLISGGSQERGLRGGTSYVAGAVGCAYALAKAERHATENNAKVAALRDRFVKKVLESVDGVTLNGSLTNRLPNNANLSFEGCEGEQILFGLDLRGVAVSTGSACSSGAVKVSHVLSAMGLSEGRAKGAVRFTFGKDNTEEECDRAAEAVREVVAAVRK